MEFRGIEETIAYAQQRWNGLVLRVDGTGSASGPCPFENQGNDRFVVSVRGHYFCRQCNAKGWLDEGDVLTAEEKRLRAIEAKQAALERGQRELESRMTALEYMAQCKDHEKYHEMLRDEDRQWWYQQGIYNDAIEEYGLGVCLTCPTDKDHGPSYTIPVMDSKWGQLLNIQHRLIHGTNGNRYRPHRINLGVQLFNSRWVLDKKEIVLVEGAKKSIVVSQHGIPTCGFPGINTFQMQWLRHFRGVKRIYLAPDPDATDAMWELGKKIAPQVDAIVAQLTLWKKPDDWFLEGGDATSFKMLMQQARRVA